MLNHEKQLHLETIVIDSTQVRAFGGGDATDRSLVDRRKKGTKYAILVDSDGVRLVVRSGPANRSDHQEILPTAVEFPAIGGKPGRPHTHPEKLYRDAGYDCEATRILLRWLGIEPHIWCRNGEYGSHLGRMRWVLSDLNLTGSSAY